MKSSWRWLAIFVMLSATGAQAQVGVEVRLEQEQFLPTETLEVSVRITNRTGQTLWLGQDSDWLNFTVEANDGRLVAKTGEVPVEGKFMLESSKVAVKRVDIAPFFALNSAGRYHVVATVNIKEWNMAASSAPRAFDIVEGTKLWAQEVGVPPTEANRGSQPEVRRYLLQQANYLRTQLRLYLRITDVTGAHTFKVIPLGKLLSFSRPEGQVDSLSNAHIIYQSGPQSFTYMVFNPHGDLLTRQTYDFGETRPRLAVGRDSRISVHGGVRKLLSSDVPPPPEGDMGSDAAASTVTNSATNTPAKQKVH